MRVLAVDGSPRGHGKTAAAVDAVVAPLSDAGWEVTRVDLADGPAGIETALVAAEGAAAFVLGSPVYRARATAQLKALLDAMPRGMWGEATAPLQGRAVAIAMTGASDHHFLALDDLRSILASFFAAHVVPPGLYVPAGGFGPTGELEGRYRDLAEQQGHALLELAQLLAASTHLQRLAPHV
jgi:FMN reductase